MTRVPSRIHPPYRVFYVQSMLFNTASAMRSIDRVATVFSRLPSELRVEDTKGLPTRKLLDDIQNVVLQGAALSRYFWPTGEVHKPRGQELRKMFDVADDGPLHSRALRNAIEHFDERLDKYLAKGAFGYFFPEYVGVKPQEEDVPGHFFRAYFIDQGIFRLLDEEYEVQPIANEILRVHNALQQADGSNPEQAPRASDA